MWKNQLKKKVSLRFAHVFVSSIQANKTKIAQKWNIKVKNNYLYYLTISAILRRLHFITIYRYVVILNPWARVDNLHIFVIIITITIVRAQNEIVAIKLQSSLLLWLFTAVSTWSSNELLARCITYGYAR